MNNNRVGTVVRQKCGMDAICTVYRSSKDADFRFENGTVKLHRQWDAFIKGKIQCVSRVDHEEGSNTRIGMSHMQKCGMNLTCIAYRGVRDCDFQFEDGHVVTHRTWQHFKAGSIARHTVDEKTAQKIGQTKMQGCGMSATCIAYRTYQDCNFRFEDGKAVEHVPWIKFERGKLPYDPRRGFTKNRVGQSRIQKCGMKLTCTAYRSATDCDFQFEDGRLIQHRTWREFENGAIRYYRRSEDPKARIGMSVRQKNGLDAVCVEYHSSTDLAVRFPDGKTASHRTWNHFTHGAILHPLFTTYNGSSDFYGYTVAKAFTDESGNVYYRCINNKTGKKSIQTLSDLIPKEQL